MTREKREQLIRHLKYNLKIGADYLITDEDAVEIIKALEQEPCEDAINRQAALDLIKGFIADATSHGISPRLDPDYVMDGIKALPPVNPQPKTGKWIYDEILDKHYYCSECRSMGVDYWDFCPNCGAKMQEVKE